jgi:hypothetical protein
MLADRFKIQLPFKEFNVQNVLTIMHFHLLKRKKERLLVGP